MKESDLLDHETSTCTPKNQKINMQFNAPVKKIKYKIRDRQSLTPRKLKYTD